MTVTPIRFESMRCTETPNAAMTTIASPTQGPTDHLSMWRVHMRAGQQGPRHVFDSEQVWYVLGGEIEVAVEDTSSRLGPGDGIVLAAAKERQIIALVDVDIVVCGRGDAVASVTGETESRGTPPWVS
jgi:quercetin dioxygenase-like cupin family protein